MLRFCLLHLSSRGSPHPSSGTSSQAKAASFSPREFCQVLLRPGVLTMLTLHFGQFMAGGLVSTMLPHFAVSMFRLTPGALGGILAAKGCVGMIAEGFLVRLVIQGLGDRNSVLVGIALGCLALVVLLAGKVWALLVYVALSAISASLGYALIPSSLVRLVPREDTGTVLGMDTAAGALSRILCPLLSARLYAAAGAPALMLSAALCMSATLLTAVVLVPASGSEPPSDRHSSSESDTDSTWSTSLELLMMAEGGEFQHSRVHSTAFSI